jgi:multidrug resistance efflux pump
MSVEVPPTPNGAAPAPNGAAAGQPPPPAPTVEPATVPAPTPNGAHAVSPPTPTPTPSPPAEPTSVPTPHRRLSISRRVAMLIGGVVALVVIPAAIVVYLRATTPSDRYTLSGTIEATQIHLAAQIGGQVQEVDVAEGTPVHKGQVLLRLYSTSAVVNDTLKSPIDGVVLERLVEPSELAAPGSTLLVVGNLDALTLKVYVPEDRYGLVSLGDTYPVSVDAFSGQVFSATVTHIANEAQFTPRNVQTVEGRKSTVFAVTLDLAPSAGQLKPGMPADVSLTAR